MDSRRRIAGVFFPMAAISAICAMTLFGWRVPLASVPDNLDFVPMEVEEAPQPPKPEPLPKPVPPSLPTEGPTHVVRTINYKMVSIKPGTFTMGSPPDEPGREGDEKQHQVTLTKGYYLGVTEVTQGQWKKVMGNNPSGFKNCGDDCPVEYVFWKDAQAFIRKLNQMESTDKYRLPTEAEWEYASRAGSRTAFSYGEIRDEGCGKDPRLDAVGWYCGNSGNKTHPVAQKQVNAWGLYDMHGNVYEWCQDWYGNYPLGSVVDPEGPLSGSFRVMRGGGWGDLAGLCRSANRLSYWPGGGFNYVGFRLARTL